MLFRVCLDLQALKGIRDKVQLATKFANYQEGAFWKVRGDPEYVRSCCENSLKRLGVDYIDLYYQHRVDDKVPIEITVRKINQSMASNLARHRCCAHCVVVFGMLRLDCGHG